MLGIVLLSQGCNARMGDSLILVVARTAALHSPDNPYKGVWAISGLGPSFVSLFLSSATQSVAGAGGPLACPLSRALFEWYICSYAGSSGVLVLIFSFFFSPGTSLRVTAPTTTCCCGTCRSAASSGFKTEPLIPHAAQKLQCSQTPQALPSKVIRNLTTTDHNSTFRPCHLIRSCSPCYPATTVWLNCLPCMTVAAIARMSWIAAVSLR